ncbi:NUDIX domain-containing protein [Microbacterium sp. NPDC077184]|uniref:NUDIX domain-containing protein n=1 Tax=Microbacterium sp. NPDC077184 TaxID=3154764 RepID=UPI0034287283
MPVTSAGLIVHRRGAEGREVLIAHMGGPFWARKDAGAWTFPKGEFDPAEEEAADAARREFREELGLTPPDGPMVALAPVAASRKVLHFFAVEADLDVADAVFGEFEMEWPPRSGERRSFPEVDRVAWVPVVAARDLLSAGQRPAIDALRAAIGEA